MEVNSCLQQPKRGLRRASAWLAVQLSSWERFCSPRPSNRLADLARDGHRSGQPAAEGRKRPSMETVPWRAGPKERAGFQAHGPARGRNRFGVVRLSPPRRTPVARKRFVEPRYARRAAGSLSGGSAVQPVVESARADCVAVTTVTGRPSCPTRLGGSRRNQCETRAGRVKTMISSNPSRSTASRTATHGFVSPTIPGTWPPAASSSSGIARPDARLWRGGGRSGRWLKDVDRCGCGTCADCRERCMRGSSEGSSRLSIVRAGPCPSAGGRATGPLAAGLS